MNNFSIDTVIDLIKQSNQIDRFVNLNLTGREFASNFDIARSQSIEMLKELKAYKDAEEKGLLLRLPCNAGDPVYRINPGAMDPIIEMIVKTIAIRHHATSGKSVCLFCEDLNDSNESYYLEKAFGNDVFFTIEEAEAALKKMQEGKE